MTTLREAALRVLAEHDAGFHGLPLTEALEALRDALAQEQAEPGARPATLTKPCGSLGEDVSLCRYPDCAGGQAGTICNNWCLGVRK